MQALFNQIAVQVPSQGSCYSVSRTHHLARYVSAMFPKILQGHLPLLQHGLPNPSKFPDHYRTSLCTVLLMSGLSAVV